MKEYKKPVTRLNAFKIITFFLVFSIIILFIHNHNLKTKVKNTRAKVQEFKFNYTQEELALMKKEFWNHKELSWIPNYFRNRKLGSSVPSLPNKFLKKDTKNTKKTKDNIGGKFYKKTRGYPPIDMVIMWVNGSDPIFQKEKENEYLKYDNCEKTCKYPIETKKSWCCPTRNKKESVLRFSEHQELKYLLRQIEQFAPWIRKIFLVTNNQIPNWLDLSNKRIKIVVPSDFVKYPESLPIFSSPALESQLHLINGLSRLFLYSNDDFFIAKPIWPGDFLTLDNTYKLRTTWRIPESDLKKYQKNPTRKKLSNTIKSIYSESIKYTDTIFDLTFGQTTRRSAPHVPMLIDGEIMERIWKEWPNEMEQTAKSKFRVGSQMHYQTTFLNYVQNSWIKIDFCNFFYLYFDSNNDKHFNLGEIKKLSYKISIFLKKDLKSVFTVIPDQIKKEWKKKLNKDNNYPNNANANKHGSENQFLGLNADCEILEKIPLIVEYYNKKMGKKQKKKHKLYRSINNYRDHFFFMINKIRYLKPAFDVIRYKKRLKFLSLNDDFEYTEKSELIKFDEEFQRLANEYWPNKSQFELPENKLNKNLRIKYS
ncbi:hypothetical protein M0813_03883 [Anaeramoeba flamelloides]|uniref:Uncharacterized protein n=1 Tax=Anaeramoeba flamelloides TaxID=1746091 RepID=A0ABQ8XUZ1_9EUKA|nr:hypothetical protein M0813_03883 [Anaeramoeba flamelloides]